ncbi:SRPBCC family protein [Nocardioides euryhalodurans]|uniref:Transcriptional regulator n=1 Tax=Nocardioides euryhalodurans TaxID=2518370 RepID=A0A4P7GPS0_9ACTN|nr:SRPBCC family protein [Nocardioides euryhalodurans]QBR93984.1 transcriptional regulator [Nocardioides euryhalodurans]
MAEYTVSRSVVVDADASRCHALVDDFHAWTAWSPWEDVDPALERTYSGPDAGVGARYAWSGNRKAGRGSMEIVSSTPERIGVQLVFEKPWKATNPVEFRFTPTGAGTRVTWTMTGDNKGVAAIFARVVNTDRLLGNDFDKGLARLKAVAEQA